MNRPMTRFERMECPMGHKLEWRGRWRHITPEVDLVMEQYGGCPPGAAFPRSYYKVDR